MMYPCATSHCCASWNAVYIHSSWRGLAELLILCVVGNARARWSRMSEEYSFHVLFFIQKVTLRIRETIGKNRFIMKSFVKSVFPLFGLLMCLTFISCSDDPEFEGPEFEMSLNKTTLALEVGKSETLVVSYNPSDTPNQGHTWGSSKPEIATVDETGKVTAKAIGECTITARSLTGNVSTTCNVQVVDKIIRVTSVSLNKTTAEIATGETLALEATILPSNATNKGVKWTSSSNEVATVDAKGVVSAVAEGETTITVTTDDNSKKATCKLTVVPVGVKFSNPTIENVTSNSALIIGSIEPRGVKISEAGICIATTSTPTVDNGKVMLLQGGGTISTVLKELKAETTYYLRFYAIVDGKVRYGNQTVFETLPAVTISAPTFSNVLAHSATVSGTISANGSSLTETGIVYSKMSMPTVADTKVVISSEKISYSLMELEASTTYYVRIYTVIGDKTYYGEQAELVTCDELITHFEPIRVSEDDILLRSKAPKGYKTINICYGTSPNPTITDNIKVVTCYGDEMSVVLTGLTSNTTYYLRSYYQEGTKFIYSNDEVEFSTVGTKNIYVSDIEYSFYRMGEFSSFYALECKLVLKTALEGEFQWETSSNTYLSKSSTLTSSNKVYKVYFSGNTTLIFQIVAASSIPGYSPSSFTFYDNQQSITHIPTGVTYLIKVPRTEKTYKTSGAKYYDNK